MRGDKGSIRWEEIEKGLGSAGRLRILKVMMRNPDRYFTRYMLKRMTGLKTVDVKSNLNILVGLGWVIEYTYGVKTYRVNMENRAVQAIAELFNKVDY